ncbi:MAG: serine/threonine protein kinase [Deltaproteobacteria bacterium]|nr:serine/threonine protein kinase [Deltaproteobacteria bacterium]
MGEPRHSTLEPGQQIGPYRIQRLIGEGGMAVVYLAEHVTLERRVAVKVLRSSYASRTDAVRSFFEEARVASQLNHSHIVQVTDLIVEPGLAACIMEYLEGRTLTQRISQEGKLPIRDALWIAHQVADAMMAAHEHGVIHRDIKPSNVFLARDRRQTEVAKLLDFGIAQLNSNAMLQGGSLSGQQAGTPAYMSPEQFQNDDVDERSDIYSLGAVLYEMMTGRPPFEAKTSAEYAYKHTSIQPTPPHQATTGPTRIPRDCSRVVMKCLAKKPEERYQNARSLMDDIDRAAKGTGVTFRNGTSPLLIATPPNWTPLLWIVGIVSAIAVSGIVGVHVLFGSDGEPNHPQKSSATVSPNVGDDAEVPQTKAVTTPPVSRPRSERQTGRLGVSQPRQTSAMGRANPSSENQRATITIHIVSRPAGAEVHRISPNPGLLGITPLDIRIPRTSRVWVIDIVGSERRSRRIRFSCNRNVFRSVRLLPIHRHGDHRHQKPRHIQDTSGTVNPFQK